MQKFEIPLIRRTGKSVFYIAAAVFNLFALSVLSVAILTNYGWWQLIILGLLLIGIIVCVKGLYEYYFYGNVKLVLESDGRSIKFYNLSSTGKKFLQSKSYSLDKIGRIYGVERTTRFLYKNYSYKFEGTSKLTKIFSEPIEVFPSLFDASKADRDAVLYHIKTLNPGIEIGYKNFIERKMSNQ